MAPEEQQVAAAGLMLSGARITTFARFEHAFTHFRMKARVLRAELDDVEAVTVLRQATATRWLAIGDAAAAPLPRPVKSLLNAIDVGRALTEAPAD
jgi:adenine-specific DNA glycosylase